MVEGCSSAVCMVRPLVVDWSPLRSSLPHWKARRPHLHGSTCRTQYGSIAGCNDYFSPLREAHALSLGGGAQHADASNRSVGSEAKPTLDQIEIDNQRHPGAGKIVRAFDRRSILVDLLTLGLAGRDPRSPLKLEGLLGILVAINERHLRILRYRFQEITVGVSNPDRQLIVAERLGRAAK